MFPIHPTVILIRSLGLLQECSIRVLDDGWILTAHTHPAAEAKSMPTNIARCSRTNLAKSVLHPFGNRNSAVWNGVITHVMFFTVANDLSTFLLLVAASIQGAWALWMGQWTRLADVEPVWASSVLKWVRAWENLRVLDLYTQPRDWNANLCCTWIQCQGPVVIHAGWNQASEELADYENPYMLKRSWGASFSRDNTLSNL